MEKPQIPSTIENAIQVEYLLEREHHLTPWTEAVRSGELADAVEQIDSFLQNKPDDLTARLWWVRCHLSLERLPVTALCSPLDEILQSAEAVKNQPLLCCSTALAAATHLLDRDQARLALSLFEHSMRIAEECSLESTLKNAIYSLYDKTLSYEIESAELRRESKNYRKELQEKLKVWKAKNHDFSKAESEPNASEQSKRASGKRLNAKQVAALASEQVDENESSAEPQRKESKLGKRALLALCLILLCYIGVRAWEFALPSHSTSIDPDKLAMTISPEVALEPISPGPGNANTLEELERNSSASLNDLGTRLKNLAVKTDKNSETTNSSAENTTPTPIDLSSGDEDTVVPISSLPNARNDIKQGKLLPVNPKSFPTTKVETVGSSPRKVPTTPSSKSSGKKDLYGKPLGAHEVQTFDPPKVFRTITSTEVLSAPSLLADSMARLERDTPVHVVRKMGYWLELVSNEGRRGYIYSQDAVSNAE